MFNTYLLHGGGKHVQGKEEHAPVHVGERILIILSIS
jgi:hypothetical protein